MTAVEIFGLSIPADLVVLSACETARGKFYRGEGAVGLPRAFMHAGAPRVVASLWKVDDRATALLMKRFYEYLRDGRRDPADALDATQQDVRSYEEEVIDAAASRAAGRDVRVRRRVFEAPRFWAAWVLWD